MAAQVFEPRVVTSLSPDGRVLFITRGVRLFGYGLISITGRKDDGA
jgi:hypothetical protein